MTFLLKFCIINFYVLYNTSQINYKYVHSVIFSLFTTLGYGSTVNQFYQK